jgi:hypothetical protein
MTTDTAPRQPVTIQDGVVVLRPFTMDDLSAVAAAFRDPPLAAWNPGPREGNDQAVRDWISQRADWSSGDHASWAISDAAGALLGSASLFRLDADQRDGELGYWLVPAARGKGFASRAVRPWRAPCGSPTGTATASITTSTCTAGSRPTRWATRRGSSAGDEQQFVAFEQDFGTCV